MDPAHLTIDENEHLCSFEERKVPSSAKTEDEFSTLHDVAEPLIHPSISWPSSVSVYRAQSS